MPTKGKIKWQQENGEGYVIDDEGKSYYFCEPRFQFDKDQEVEFEVFGDRADYIHTV
jgi:YHS domain-containing protein